MKARFDGRLVIALACALGMAACGNPVQDNLKKSLGGEAPGVPRGPLHRPGQPCLVCHSPAGGRHPDFSVAGTVYQNQNTKVPAHDVLVKLTDSQGRTYSVATNCAGNFYVDERDYSPVYPMTVTMHYGTLDTPMFTKIYRNGSCASCHTDPTDYSHASHVYIDRTGLKPFPPGCQ